MLGQRRRGLQEVGERSDDLLQPVLPTPENGRRQYDAHSPEDRPLATRQRLEDFRIDQWLEHADAHGRDEEIESGAAG